MGSHKAHEIPVDLLESGRGPQDVGGDPQEGGASSGDGPRSPEGGASP